MHQNFISTTYHPTTVKYVVENKDKQSIKYHPKSANLFIMLCANWIFEQEKQANQPQRNQISKLDVEISNENMDSICEYL